ncbi:uncharacterized protein LOC117324602 [Pecten maximus]|uniref:uncharacterized protein LOC117324602 n=1 Tax=Pecten maximus TaxID=6579 RepID=UPI001458E53B|nr:uncharacterized protein LOC117324602 [Pecten maximus]
MEDEHVNVFDNSSDEEDTYIKAGFGSSRPEHKRKRVSSTPDREETPVSTPQNNVIIKCIKTKLGNKNPIMIQKSLSAVSGYPVKGVRAMPNGDLMVTCLDSQQKKNFLKCSKLGEFVVTIKEPVSINRTDGVIYGVTPDLSEADIVDTLKENGVTKALRMKGRAYDTADSSTTVKLTFNDKVLPERVNIGYRSYQVKLYVPPPLRCYKCNRYGHMAVNCKGKQRCQKCGGDHKVSECENTEKKCVNCGGDHSAAYGGCPARKKAIEIIKIQTKERCTRREAVIKSFAQVVTGNAPTEKGVRTNDIVDVDVQDTRSSYRPSARPSVQPPQGPQEPTVNIPVQKLITLAISVYSKYQSGETWPAIIMYILGQLDTLFSVKVDPSTIPIDMSQT